MALKLTPTDIADLRNLLSAAQISNSGIADQAGIIFSKLTPNFRQLTFADSPYDVQPTDGVLEVDATGGNVELRLPLLYGQPFTYWFTFKKTDASTNVVYVELNGAGSDSIEEHLDAITLAAQYNGATILGDPTLPSGIGGAKWVVMAATGDFSTAYRGDVPVSPGGVTMFLRADKQWAIPPTSGGGGGGGSSSQGFANSFLLMGG